MDLLTIFSGVHHTPTALFDPFCTKEQQPEEVLGRLAAELEGELSMIRAHHQALAAEFETSRQLVEAVQSVMRAFLRSGQEVGGQPEVALFE
jgi:hypothetical protein